MSTAFTDPLLGATFLLVLATFGLMAITGYYAIQTRATVAEMRKARGQAVFPRLKADMAAKGAGNGWIRVTGGSPGLGKGNVSSLVSEVHAADSSEIGINRETTAIGRAASGNERAERATELQVRGIAFAESIGSASPTRQEAVESPAGTTEASHNAFRKFSAKEKPRGTRRKPAVLQSQRDCVL